MEARYRVRTMIRGEGWQYRLGSSLHNLTEMENTGVSDFADRVFYLIYVCQKIVAGMTTAVAVTVVGLLLRKRILRRRGPIN